MCIIKSKYSREKEGSREDKVNIECERERKRERSEENGRRRWFKWEFMCGGLWGE